jgi:hypothetical protein
MQEMNDLNWFMGFGGLRCLYNENFLADKLRSLFSENTPYDEVIYSNKISGTRHILQLVGLLRQCGCGLHSSSM